MIRIRETNDQYIRPSFKAQQLSEAGDNSLSMSFVYPDDFFKAVQQAKASTIWLAGNGEGALSRLMQSRSDASKFSGVAKLIQALKAPKAYYARINNDSNFNILVYPKDDVNQSPESSIKFIIEKGQPVIYIGVRAYTKNPKEFEKVLKGNGWSESGGDSKTKRYELSY